MTREKIPTIRQMKNWIATNTVSSVNGETGDVTAVNSVNGKTGDVTITDADTVDGYDIQKNGIDASGVINFKT